jgi:hypothetical protein
MGKINLPNFLRQPAILEVEANTQGKTPQFMRRFRL